MPSVEDKWWLVEKDGKVVNENSDEDKDSSEEDKNEGKVSLFK